MTTEASSEGGGGSSAGAPSAGSIRAAALGLVAAGIAAYHNSFRGVFVFDDHPSLIENDTIRNLWDLRRIAAPPLDSTMGGRPVGNFTLAVNYALGGLDPWGYHAVNLLIHLAAGLALFGIMRRTLLQPSLRARFGACSLPLAFATAVLWVLHPLQTESVTYVIQRVESLAGLFYLLTLYAFIRSTDGPARGRWQCLSVAACLLGMGSKEVMASAPLLVLLYDRTFVAGSVREAWRLRRGYYACLGATWLLLGFLVAGTSSRAGTAGFGSPDSPWHYLLTQCWGIVHYLRLFVWPHPLILDYGWGLVASPLSVLPQALLLTGLAAGTVWAIARRSALGVAGAWFFAILGPSSSVVPVSSQTLAEHRMYLPLAAVVALAVTGSFAWFGRRSLAAWLAVAVAWGCLTARRNTAYFSELTMARETVAARPDNPRALAGLGNFLYRAGDAADAVPLLEQAIRLEPRYPHAYISLGAVLLDAGRIEDARRLSEGALRLQPSSPDAHHNLGLALYSEGRYAEAISEYRAALGLDPNFPEAEADLGLAMAAVGRVPEAVGWYERALRLDPGLFAAQNNLGTALLNEGRYREAGGRLEAAVRLHPDSAAARGNLGLALYAQGREDAAIAQFEAALRAGDRSAATRRNLGLALEAGHRPADARRQYAAALAIDPSDSIARRHLSGLGGASD